ncbi:zinc finger protein klf1 [Apiospora rasikravindrae]|uniref:Zinc finger protein klf1 n=1 Tax=Apiospora rasikravindrae TaxID=990691 RepID=A0ABR1TX42_9PEZI
MTQMQRLSPPRFVKREEKAEVGRMQTHSPEQDMRAIADDNDQDADGDADTKHDNSSTDGGPSRKRRRSRKGLDKKFECPHDGSNATYSANERGSLWGPLAWFDTARKLFQSSRQHASVVVHHAIHYPTKLPAFLSSPSDFSSASANGPRETGQSYAPATSSEYNDHPPHTSGEMVLLDQMTNQTTIPVFGTDGVSNKSPYISMTEDFISYLFNTQTMGAEGSPSMSPVVPQGQHANYGNYQTPYGMPYYGNDAASVGYIPPSHQPQQVMSVTNLLDQNLPESLLSEEKSQEIFDFIKERFQENHHAPVERQRDNILDGDRSNERHMLSRKMMQAYIGSYWLHFSDQIPILHKPSFSPDKTDTLLLLAVMAIGASCLDRSHSQSVTRAGAELSNFLAWHLRWEIFMNANFRPPAKLWVFQTLILLELYEKMYSTRELHERAHIHHATTITLMRRGRSLIGKSALDSPPNPRDDKQGLNGSRHSSTSGMAHTPDEWWNHWITNEATRRAAFAAFLIDSTHATMFGHSTVMVAHEMRLPLPCDEQLWKATSGLEVNRIEANLMSNGVKPLSFLEGLKRTLGGHEVQTNSFGRQILMAGLLSVSWHMNQRDLQVTSLGGNLPQALGGRDKWRSTLTRAFDSWKTDFDKSLQRNEAASDPYSYEKRSEANVVFESRTVLHHLAHMAMHVDVVDCQIFARAKRLLGRTIGTQDLNSAQRRMKDNWAPSAKARDATFYALKFLCSVLLANSAESPGSEDHGRKYLPYSARDDVLLNRPWVLYFAGLVVWCYGGWAQCHLPEELKLTKGVNKNSAMLMILKEAFELTRWELLHEGATLLNNCIQLNNGISVS